MFRWVYVTGTRGTVNGINGFIIQELPTHSRYNRSEDFILLPTNRQGTSSHDCAKFPWIYKSDSRNLWARKKRTPSVTMTCTLGSVEWINKWSPLLQRQQVMPSVSAQGGWHTETCTPVPRPLAVLILFLLTQTGPAAGWMQLSSCNSRSPGISLVRSWTTCPKWLGCSYGLVLPIVIRTLAAH